MSESRKVGSGSGAARPSRDAARSRKCAEQHRHVVAPLPQGRQAQGDHVEAVEEVLAERTLRRQHREIRLGGGNDAEIDGDFLVGPQPLDGPLLQDAQKAHLRGGRHRFDLVEKERAAACVFELADAALARTRERARLMAEQLALDHRFGNRPAIDRHEPALPAAPEIVKGARRHLLAGSGLPEKQHVGV